MIRVHIAISFHYCRSLSVQEQSKKNIYKLTETSEVRASDKNQLRCILQKFY